METQTERERERERYVYIYIYHIYRRQIVRAQMAIAFIAPPCPSWWEKSNTFAGDGLPDPRLLRWDDQYLRRNQRKTRHHRKGLACFSWIFMSQQIEKVLTHQQIRIVPSKPPVIRKEWLDISWHLLTQQLYSSAWVWISSSGDTCVTGRKGWLG